MNRRRILALAAGTGATAISGCLGSGWPGAVRGPEEDPYPTAVERGERGGADTIVSTTVEPGTEYADASIDCARAGHDAVRAHLEEELGDLRNVGTGYGRGPEEHDGMAVTVSLTTATYGRDGELVEEADLEFETVVAATPPTAYVRTDDGGRVCAVPVYVGQAEAHID